MPERPAPEVIAAVVAAAGRVPARWTRIEGGGYTPAERWLVSFDDGTRAFAKVGSTPLVAGWLRREHEAYAQIAGPFMPALLGWNDGPMPVLLLEDLSAAEWPPPWRPALVDRVLETLTAVAETPWPPGAPPVEEEREIFSGWSEIAADPTPFLSLGLATERWLDAALPALLDRECPAELAGNDLLHFDVRSDNMCFANDRALLVDWNAVHRGNRLFDVAAWLPSLVAEGGPRPEDVSAEASIFAPALAGYFCARAPLPLIPDAPLVRRVQLQQAVTSLPWAARSLGLPTPDGRHRFGSG